MKILVLHGPNLNLLGEREPGVYGRTTLAEIDAGLREQGAKRGATVDSFQSNHEGQLIDRIQAARRTHRGIIINPGTVSAAYGGESTVTQALGVTPAYAPVRNVEMAEGSFISDEQMLGRAAVVVLGPDTVETLFGRRHPAWSAKRCGSRGNPSAFSA